MNGDFDAVILIEPQIELEEFLGVFFRLDLVEIGTA